MEQTESDWNSWEIGCEAGDSSSLIDPFQKNEDASSVVSGEGGKSDTMYDSSNVEGEESTYQFERDFESLEEMSESMSDEEEEDGQRSQVVIDQSPYRFMNGNDGMATCERCGAVGIKHAFYSKSKRFCSLACSRAAANGEEYIPPQPLNIPKKQVSVKKPKSGKFIRQRNKHSNNKQGVVRSFDWGSYILGSHAEGAPVSCFKHVPMTDCWDNITVGMKVEVQNFDCDLQSMVYWIATVIKLAGYKALLRYEGFSGDGHKDFWINLCHKEVHPVGWCATSGKPLVPPKTIQHKYSDWKDYLVKRLTGSRTLPSNFFSKVQEGINNHKFHKDMHVEVVNRMCVSAMRVATVEEVIGGRLRLRYADSKEEDEFWCHMRSALIHQVGWSQQVGHKLHCSAEYRNQCLSKVAMQKYDVNDATPDMFPRLKRPPADGYAFQVGQKLEAIDPLNLSAVCVATVMKVLKNNYLMIGIDGSIAQNGTDWFCYHATSPCIFPVGFCEVNGLQLTPPRGYKTPFRWFDYLKQTRSTAAPVKLFDKEIPKHGFKSGMKLEAVDLMEPRLICVATIAKVVGRLLRIHFDGWESEYDQWVDCESPDLYPIGWCEVMNYPVEGPRLKTEVPNAPQVNPGSAKKRKGKTQIYKGPRKKRKPKNPLSPPPGVKSMSSQFDIMRHRILNTRPDEMTERPQEVPQVSELLAEITKPKIEVKSEPLESPRQVPSLDRNHSSLTSIPDIKPALNRTPSNTSLPRLNTVNNQSASKPGRTSSLPTNVSTATKSALLERINSSPNSVPQSLKTSMLAGHLTGAIPIRQNSGLVPTTSPATAGSQTVILGNQSNLLPGPQQSVSEPQTLYLTQRQQSLSPDQWSVIDVCHFLKYNDCSAYVEIFHRKNINGEQFVKLNKEQIASLTGMKVGSSLKVYDLIQVLKSKLMSQKLSVTTS
ncbi:MBT domain-containing protein 1-like isoform X1 [Ruditapes philippinarum]|uniref:MBT domain-containing protein 1-like isoform X1 n=1 Tax=Ruditapes philippinarum TaxID=129788 RepID=UPI00295A9C2B|nr:MBT domain-containing protein 1-like isoform X1 [Ruditapes philippinarum]